MTPFLMLLFLTASTIPEPVTVIIENGRSDERATTVIEHAVTISIDVSRGC